MNERFAELLREAVTDGVVRFNEPLKSYTSFKTGGPADYFVIPAGTTELKRIITLAKDNQTPYYIIGNGSNLLVSDEGFRGLIICMKEPDGKVSFTDEGDTVLVEAGAGCPLTRLAFEAARAGLTGLEFAAGIPGSVGGAVVMNAGAYGGEIKDCIVSADVIDVNGVQSTLDNASLELSYRHSVIPERGLIVTGAAFRLNRGNTEEILAVIADLNKRRRDKQPLEYPSAGSTFKRPEGYFAGKLIEDAGLKGFSVGGASVSEKHCGFVINRGNATSSDIMELIRRVGDKVYEASGVRLEPEVKLLGF